MHARLKRHVHLASIPDLLVGDALSLAGRSVCAQIRCMSGAGEGARIIENRSTVVAWMGWVEAATSKPV